MLTLNLCSKYKNQPSQAESAQIDIPGRVWLESVVSHELELSEQSQLKKGNVMLDDKEISLLMADIVAADAEWREWLDSDQLGAITDGTAPAMAASSSSCIKEEQAEDKTKSAQALVKLQEAYDTTTRLNKDFSIRDLFFEI